MVCFDWLHLTKLNVFRRFFPETMGCKGYESFGSNWKSQLIRLAFFSVMPPVITAILSRLQLSGGEPIPGGRTKRITQEVTMVQRIKTMPAPEMEQVCRRMADAFVDYEMTGKNLGMCEHLDREHFTCFIRSYFELAVRNGSLYSAGDHHEGYFIFETPETKGSLYGSLLQMKWMLRAFGFKKGVKYVKEIMDSGPYLASEFRKEKKPFTKIEFIAVDEEYQGRGYMRKMIDYAFSESDRLELPCILTTDDEKKVKIYEHFGMKLARRHVLSAHATYYEMLRATPHK